MSRHRRRLWLGIIAAVITAAVAFGVVAAVQRGRLEDRERLAEARRAADVVSGIVEESLEELRIRESARPFDQYNPVYAPEGVLAASDALAPSPLSRAPDDQRVRGWVQFNPDGTLTLPFDDARPEAARVVRALAEADAFAPLRGLTSGPTAGALVAQATTPNGYQQASRSSFGDTRIAQNAPNDAKGLVQQLNMASSNVYSQLKEAEPEPSKRAALASNEKLPQVQRQDVEWSEETLGNLGTKAKRNTKASKKPMPSKLKEPTQKMTPTPALPLPPPPKPSTTDTTVAVSYTPMVFDELDGGVRVLHRTVSSTADGATTVQAVILDEPALRAWLEGIVARRIDTDESVALIGSDDDVPCDVRTHASTVLDDIDLCFTAADNAPRSPWEILVLLSLLGLVGAVVVVLDRASERAEVLARQRTAFISAVSHELRTPLTTLRMHAELLRDGLVTDPDKAHKFHSDMVQESVRLSHLVENVLEAQRLEEGRRPLRLASTDLGAFVRQVVDNQRPLIEQRGFTVAVAVDANADDVDALRCSVDQQAVEQMVVNLVENAVKYASDGETRHIDVAVGHVADAVVIAVADRGPGVPRGDRERVFSRFTRVERPGEEHVAGSGLGLALVRELAVAHGGTARIVDTEVGCRVEVTLPLRTVEG